MMFNIHRRGVAALAVPLSQLLVIAGSLAASSALDDSPFRLAISSNNGSNAKRYLSYTRSSITRFTDLLSMALVRRND